MFLDTCFELILVRDAYTSIQVPVQVFFSKSVQGSAHFKIYSCGKNKTCLTSCLFCYQSVGLKVFLCMYARASCRETTVVLFTGGGECSKTAALNVFSLYPIATVAKTRRQAVVTHTGTGNPRPMATNKSSGYVLSSCSSFVHHCGNAKTMRIFWWQNAEYIT